MARSNWMIAGCLLVVLGLTGCSSDDVEDVLGIDPEGEIAEAAVEEALNEVVGPLLTAANIVSGLMSTPPAPAVAGLSCPDTTGLCSSDAAVSCAVGAGQLEFTFNSCTATDDAQSVTMTGGINVVPSTSLTLVNLVLNGGSALNGTVTLSGQCNMVWNINAADGTVLQGTIVECEADPYPQPTSSLVITTTVANVGVVQMTFTFSASVNAAVSVTLDGAAYATCSVSVLTYQANCDGV